MNLVFKTDISSSSRINTLYNIFNTDEIEKVKIKFETWIFYYFYSINFKEVFACMFLITSGNYCLSMSISLRLVFCIKKNWYFQENTVS